ncbi:RloB domain-containing protein [Listeria monocytogenes]|uniref:RloB family protein n=1 Tax=Listeria monocytogenes TaxID=1639 RepID=UPI0011F3F9B9|nr:RloB family protein [Listeria monocytogenes]TYW05592.1 RloB domain-containing protein [Listeria monocytogenes]
MSRRSQDRSKSLNNSYFVVCEGETEKNYLKHLRQKYSRRNVEVKTVTGSGQAYELVEYTIKTINNRGKAFKKSIKKTYVVFDKDEIEATKIQKAFKLASKNDINICFSNINFDLWLLLHFQELQKERVIEVKKLNDNLAEVLNIANWCEHKASPKICEKLTDKIQQAFNNWEKIKENNKENNPYTDVPKMLQEIFQREKW